MPSITINGVTLDPAADTPTLKTLELFKPDAAASDYILLQTTGPLSAPQKAQLRDAGVKLLEFVPQDTYIAEFKGTDLEGLRALPFIAWANEYMEGFKISPRLHAAAHKPQASLLELHSLPHGPDSALEQVDVVLHRDADPAAAVAALAAVAGVNPSQLQVADGKIRVTVDTDRLGPIARIDQVRHIEPVFEVRLWNNVARGVMGVDTAMASVSLAGEGQIIAVCDTGFDTGDAKRPHPAFEGRVKSIRAYGRIGDPSDPQGHGTHVCGSALGDGHSKEYGPVRGTAPKATLVMQSIMDAAGRLSGLKDGLSPILQHAYDDGARVHSNSWGDTNNGYGQMSRQLDDFVWKNRDVVILVAAGNSGRDGNADGVVDAHSVGSPGTAKNCITVGASENDRPDFHYVDANFKFSRYGEGWGNQFPVPPLKDDKLADNPNGMAAFSSRGPTADGRIKPDVVAPGTGILSTRSRAKGVANGWGPSKDPLYYFQGGTSMSTPLVAGCAAVVREFLHKRGNTQPSAALVKAMLVNAADPLAGQYTPSETGAVPNTSQGFGRANLAAAVDALDDSRIVAFYDEKRALDTGEEDVITIELDTHVAALKVTLVWTDPPGETLQNDLDLIVQSACGKRGIGNAPPGSTIPDRHNNVEQVTLLSVPAGKVSIKVKAFRIAIEPQSYALVARALNKA